MENLGIMIDFLLGHTSTDVFLNQFSINELVMCVVTVTLLMFGICIIFGGSVDSFKDFLIVIAYCIILGIMPYLAVFWITAIALPFMFLCGKAAIGTGSIICLLTFVVAYLLLKVKVLDADTDEEIIEDNS